jgi:hypothetical protein
MGLSPGAWVKSVLGAAALAAFAMAASASSAPARLAVECGGFPLQYGTTIAAINNHPRSVIAVAPVMSASDNRPVAWIVWDERGDGWLGLARFSPADLKRLWIFPTKPDFTGPGLQLRFTYLKTPLPKKYGLTYCPYVTPAIGR